MIVPRVLLLISVAASCASAFSSLATKAAFVGVRQRSVSPRFTALAAAAPTIEAPTREQTDRKTGQSQDKDDRRTNDKDNDWDYPDLEYLQDAAESREMDDPFHILLLGSTFEKPKVTVPYVSGSLQYVLGMPNTEAVELSSFAHEHGLSCLGTWPREECLSLGKQLQVRDIVCRVVPFAEGGQRGWQAKDASSNSVGAGKSSSEGWSTR
jgi:ATP-dependent Clp protease adapter protein ClpS